MKKKKLTVKEERRIRALKVMKIINAPVDYTLRAQVCRLRLQQPTP